MNRSVPILLLLLAFGCWLMPSMAFAQFARFAAAYEAYNEATPQEQTYLEYDHVQGCYPGDTIRFTAHVVRTDQMSPTDLSRIVYVDLLTPYGATLDVQKLTLTNGQAHGQLCIDSLMLSGFYELRAYTRYQTNWTPGHYFSRVLPVYCPPHKVQKKSSKHPDTKHINLRSYQQGGKWSAKAHNAAPQAPQQNRRLKVRETQDSIYILPRLHASTTTDSVGLAILCHGHVEHLDSFPLDSLPPQISIDKRKLRSGVHQIIFFTSHGKRIASTRHFCGEMHSQQERYLLLESEIQDYHSFRDAKPEQFDDILNTSLWTPYPWEEMTKRAGKLLTQPVERHQMVFGHITPRVKHPTTADWQLEDRSFKIYLSQGKTAYTNEVTTDWNGRFATYLPDLSGDWYLTIPHATDMSRHRVCIDRGFAPPLRNYQPEELLPQNFAEERWQDDPNGDGTTAIYYDCTAANTEIMNRGSISQRFYSWLQAVNPNFKKMKGYNVSPTRPNLQPDTTYNKQLDINLPDHDSSDPRTVCIDGPSYANRPIVWIVNGCYRLVTSLNKRITDFSVLRPTRRNLPIYIDEVRSVYITQDPAALQPYLRCSVLERRKPVTVFITLYDNYIWNDAGLISTHFQGLTQP